MGMLGGGRTIDSVWHHYEKVGGVHKTALTRSENFATNHAGMRCVNMVPPCWSAHAIGELTPPISVHVHCPHQADSSSVVCYQWSNRSRINVECTLIPFMTASEYAMPLEKMSSMLRAHLREAHAHHTLDHSICRGLLAGQNSPVAAVVASVFGKPVTLYKEKINYKLPGGGGYRAHQVCADSLTEGSIIHSTVRDD